MPITQAVRVAALSITDDEGKRHPHQRRIPQAALDRGAMRLARLDLQRAASFRELHELVAGVARRTIGLGEVWAYDVATRIGQACSQSPAEYARLRTARHDKV